MSTANTHDFPQLRPQLSSLRKAGGGLLATVTLVTLATLGCASGSSNGSTGSNTPATTPTPNRKLSPSDIVAAMGKVRPQVQSCANRYRRSVSGDAIVKLAETGQILDVEIKGDFAGTPLGDCVRGAIRTAVFPPSLTTQIDWSFVFNPQ